MALPALLAAGCGSKPDVKPVPPPEPRPETPLDKSPPVLNIEIRAAADANRGPSGKGLPVVVRVYTLKSPGVFTTTDFYSLYDKEGALLGADLIARDEVTLAPGQSRPLERQLDPGAGYLGAVAAFRDIDHSRWRETLRLNPGVDNRVLIEVGARAVSIRYQ
ncbi:type VI secretion system lipoprotein TssJ [Thiorhodococcus mannitoliphagus]|uniref:Type VI secretion system lipoprotein TssJ n=2 Tax=Thiorhodococcus mannitoliphagus TaxID=329406 RepID=A0A6P1DZ60_9GAMM|nr:type VI secretion system lipoprotein TssJ [Thiorhodococcus mannitoliphagus]